jgi:hypothetical protein
MFPSSKHYDWQTFSGVHGVMLELSTYCSNPLASHTLYSLVDELVDVFDVKIALLAHPLLSYVLAIAT